MPGNLLRGITYHIVGGNYTIDALFRSEDGRPKGLGAADIVIFQGGTDINPQFYGQQPHPQTETPDVKRDRMEYALFRSLDKKQWKVGICRGAQFLNVMNGGRLWQHIEGHRGAHILHYKTEANVTRAFNVSSTHHQMMIPPVTGSGHVWGYAQETTIREYPDGRKIKLDGKFARDPEIVYFQNTQCLAFQPHPEYDKPAQTRELFFRCLTRMIEE